MVAKRMVKNTIYPINHYMRLKFPLNGDSASADYATGIPLITQDEAIDLSATYTNPEHASFANVLGGNCATDSTVDSAFARFSFTLDKGTYEIDKIEELTIGVMPIFTSFGDELDKTDTVSTNTVKALLELTKEATDKQIYFIYTGTDITGAESGYDGLGANQAGLTTDDNLERVAFLPANYTAIKDMKKYSNEIGGLLKKIVPLGMIFRTVRRRRTTTIVFKKNVNSKVKRMNPYTFCGFIVWLPRESEFPQLCMNGDLTSIPHIIVNYESSYYEWNENAVHTKQ